MAITVEQVDMEIAKLQRIRELLVGDSVPARRRRGVTRTTTRTGPKRIISEAARKKISEAQKARWANLKKA